MIDELEPIGLAHIRDVIARILAKTEAAKDHATVVWGGGSAWRQALDNLQAGRLHLRTAHGKAAAALEALDGGDPWTAAALVRSAESFYIAALEAALARAVTRDGRPALEALVQGAAMPRGRPGGRTLGRDRRLAAAIGPRYSASAARAAVDADPELKLAFRGMTARTLLNAYNRGSQKSSA